MGVFGFKKSGVTETHKVSWVRRLKEKNKASFVGIQETQISDSQCLNIRGCWGRGNFNSEAIHSSGRSGGILSIWDPNVFKVKEEIKSSHYIITIGAWTGIQRDIAIANVYGPQGQLEKK